MKSYGIIFDCDGTLIDSLGLGLESYNHAFTQIGETPRPLEMIKPYFGSSADRILMKVLKDEKRAGLAFEHYMEAQTRTASKVPLHSGIRELLETLRQHGVPMGIVTGRHTRDLAVGLEPHKLSEYFGSMIADDQLQNSKPAPEGIFLAAKQLGLDPRKTLYVGDSVTDLQAAHNAGAAAVAALWDELAVPDLMAKENPRYTARSPMDVWSSFEEFTRGV